MDYCLNWCHLNCLYSYYLHRTSGEPARQQLLVFDDRLSHRTWWRVFCLTFFDWCCKRVDNFAIVAVVVDFDLSLTEIERDNLNL